MMEKFKHGWFSPDPKKEGEKEKIEAANKKRLSDLGDKYLAETERAIQEDLDEEAAKGANPTESR